MGDQPGHEFHGNQWTAGGSAEAKAWAEKIKSSDKSPASPKFVAAVQEAVAALPPGVIEKFRLDIPGHQLPTVVVRGDLKGSPHAVTHRLAVGFHDGENQRIFIMERTMSGDKNSDPKGNVAHEIGHAVAWNTGVSSRFWSTFREEHDKLPPGPRSYAKYYRSNEREAFAETFSHVFGMGRDSCSMSRAAFEQKFSGSIAQLKQDMGVS
jgi:hypothetical protein